MVETIIFLGHNPKDPVAEHREELEEPTLSRSTSCG
jgi:hypothetical protein